MLNPRSMVSAVAGYLTTHPEEIERMVRSGFGLRFGLPLAAFRWLVDQVVRDAKAVDVLIEAVPPGLRLGGTLEKMGTRFRATADVYISNVHVSGYEARVEVRLENVRLKVLSEKKTQLSALIKSGALDLSNPGSLISELPGIPSLIVDAVDNRIVVDVFQAPALRENRLVQHFVGLLSSLITVHGVQTERDHLDVMFRALPRGGFAAAGAVQEHVVEPGLRRFWGRLSRSVERGRVRRLLSAVAGDPR